jgi:hypothetical protein
MDRKDVDCPHNGTPLSDRKNELLGHRMEESQDNYVEFKKSKYNLVPFI